MKTERTYIVSVKNGTRWIQIKECKTRAEALDIICPISGTCACKITERILIESTIYEDDFFTA